VTRAKISTTARAEAIKQALIEKQTGEERDKGSLPDKGSHGNDYASRTRVQDQNERLPSSTESEKSCLQRTTIISHGEEGTQKNITEAKRRRTYGKQIEIRRAIRTPSTIIPGGR